MVRYYGRARQRTGSVNTNQLGLKMSGCPGKVGLNPVNNRYIQQRVACNRGVCGIPKVHGVDWRYSMSNAYPFCAEPSGKCLAAAGGIRNIRVPYYRTVQPGKQGCTKKGQFGNYPPNLNVDPVGLDARHFPSGHTPTVNPDGSISMYHFAGTTTTFTLTLPTRSDFEAAPTANYNNYGIWVDVTEDGLPADKAPDYFQLYTNNKNKLLFVKAQGSTYQPATRPASVGDNAQFYTCKRIVDDGRSQWWTLTYVLTELERKVNYKVLMKIFGAQTISGTAGRMKGVASGKLSDLDTQASSYLCRFGDLKK